MYAGIQVGRCCCNRDHASVVFCSHTIDGLPQNQEAKGQDLATLGAMTTLQSQVAAYLNGTFFIVDPVGSGEVSCYREHTVYVDIDGDAYAKLTDVPPANRNGSSVREVFATMAINQFGYFVELSVRNPYGTEVSGAAYEAQQPTPLDGFAEHVFAFTAADIPVGAEDYTWEDYLLTINPT